MKKTQKSVLCVLVCLAAIIPVSTVAYAFSWERFVGLRQWDFDRIAVNGFGDSANSYAWSVACLNGDILVGTNRHHMWSLMQGMGGLIPEMPPDMMPDPPVSTVWGAEDWAEDFSGRIWRYGGGSWSCVHFSDVYYGELPIVANPMLPPPPEVTGYYPEAYGYRTMGVYNGEIFAVGIGTWVPNMPWVSVIKSDDGYDWEDITGNLVEATNPRGLVEWNGELYLSASLPGTAPAGAGVGVVYRYNPDADNDDYWEQVSEPGFGNLDNVEIPYLAVYNGCLYASTVNFNTGFEVWKTRGVPADSGGYEWTCVIDEGYGDTYNQWGMTMEPFNGKLYIGTAVGGGMVLKDGQPVGTRAFDLIRLDRYDNAQLIVGAYKPSDPLPGWPRYRVPLSLWPAGFANPFNVYVWHMCVHNGWLYLATYDETSHLLLMADAMLSQPGGISLVADEDSPLAQLREKLDDFGLSQLSFLQRYIIKRLAVSIDAGDTPVISRLIQLMLRYFGGADLWKSRDGIHWVPVTINGFDNYLNFGFRRLLSVQEGDTRGLVLGTSNAFTGDPHGGCEILIGR